MNAVERDVILVVERGVVLVVVCVVFNTVGEVVWFELTDGLVVSTVEVADDAVCTVCVDIDDVALLFDFVESVAHNLIPLLPKSEISSL